MYFWAQKTSPLDSMLQSILSISILYQNLMPAPFQYLYQSRQLLLFNYSMNQKQTALKTQYAKDADIMATKSRFGFFTILPSHTAAITDCAQKKAHKDQNGKVVCQSRGIYSGSKSTKVLSKTCFSQIKSPFVGCPYVDPGRSERLMFLQEKKKWQSKQIFKPARLQKSLISSSYAYISLKPQDKTKKYRDADGKVITSPANFCSNLLSKLQYQKSKAFKYAEDPYDNKKLIRKQELDADLAERGEPFKAGNPVKEYFVNNKKLFDDTSNFKKTQVQPTLSDQKHTSAKIKHQSNFRPSSGYFTKYNGMFNKLTYKEQGKAKQRPQTADKTLKQSESFKSMNKFLHSKPCPSVSLNKMNLMRCMR